MAPVGATSVGPIKRAGCGSRHLRLGPPAASVSAAPARLMSSPCQLPASSTPGSRNWFSTRPLASPVSNTLVSLRLGSHAIHRSPPANTGSWCILGVAAVNRIPSPFVAHRTIVTRWSCTSRISLRTWDPSSVSVRLQPTGTQDQ